VSRAAKGHLRANLAELEAHRLHHAGRRRAEDSGRHERPGERVRRERVGRTWPEEPDRQRADRVALAENWSNCSEAASIWRSQINNGFDADGLVHHTFI
jgi:hypothetical protein